MRERLKCSSQRGWSPWYIERLNNCLDLEPQRKGTHQDPPALLLETCPAETLMCVHKQPQARGHGALFPRLTDLEAAALPVNRAVNERDLSDSGTANRG